MANGIWEPIREPIKKQIEKRQSLMLQNSNYSQRVTYLNKRCDIRVTPLSYDITSEESYPNFVFNNDYIEGIIGNTYKNQKERPFIENFELENRTGGDDKVGVLRKGRISLKIFTKEQFNQIEKYFRIGSAMLIEWGWSKYVLSSGNSGYFKSHLYSKFTDKILEESDILNHISTQTLESEGNYDAAIMFINNFSINFENSTNDYFYTLNIDFIGKSLLLNEIVTTNQESDGEQEKKVTNNQDQIFSTPLINFLRLLETIYNKNEITDYLIYADEESNDVLLRYTDQIFKSNLTTKEELIDNLLLQTQIEGNNTKFEKVTVTQRRNSGTNSGVKEFSTNIYSYNYIKLKYFLKLLEPLFQNKYDSLNQTYILPDFLDDLEENIDSNFYESLTGNSIPFPFYERAKLFCSLDTRICILPHSRTDGYKIENIYLRVTYLKNILLDYYKSDNSNYNNIIISILNDINRVTVNELNLEYYPIDTGKYSIISNIVNINNTLDYLKMKAYNVGSIMEEVAIDTTIDSKVATTIAIGSLGQKIPEVQVEAVGLLKFNKNIKSRLRTEFSEDNNSASIIERETRLINNILKLKKFTHNQRYDDNGKLLGEKSIPQLFQFTSDGLINFSKDDIFTDLINTFKKLKTDHTQKALINRTLLSRNTPLIPLKYNFSIPGISGLVNTNVFRIEDERLPDTYKTSQSYFIITGIKQTINNRDWKTSISTNFQLS
jgi:hypothetical protein